MIGIESTPKYQKGKKNIMNTKNLLPIGIMSKLTKASIQSLRYYEEINLLEPAYTDPTSGYRYYSFDQKCLVEVIQICIELDIPLKKLITFMEADDVVNFSALLEHGKEIAEKKLASIQKGLEFIQALHSSINTNEKTFYTRDLPGKHLYATPLNKPIHQITHMDIIKAAKLHQQIEDYAELFHYGLADVGVMSIYKKGNPKHYMFTELPKHVDIPTNIIEIPAGQYLCTQRYDSGETRQLENAPEIFADFLQDCQDFVAVEVDVYTHKYQTNKLVNELRVMKL